jgi:adenine-specific DNA-methyltransferase
MSRSEVVNAECLSFMRTMGDASVDAIITDPPYFRVKGEEWDRQWDDADRFIAWVGELADEWQRILRPNGSLYVFASPRMAARVEVEVGRRFEVLNHIVWQKQRYTGWRVSAESQRSYLPSTERIIFAEQFGADGSALRGSGYAAATAELHAGVFEPLRAYLVAERDRAGFTNRQVDEHLGTCGMAGHYFGASQWALPTQDAYEKIRALLNRDGGEYLRREYEYLRREYEDLRREYEDLRRPFVAPTDAHRADVWVFDGTPAETGRHPCEKPVDLMEHIIRTSTRPGAVVLDPFAGSGSTGVACRNLGRDFIGIEKDPKWCAVALNRINAPQPVQLALAA